MRTEDVSRRAFLVGTGIATAWVGGAAVVGTAVSLGPQKATVASATTPNASASGDHAMPMADAASAQEPTWQEMDQHHGDRTKAFPAKTAVHGGKPLQPRVDGEWKVFDLTCQEVQWEVESGKMVKAWAYNGQVPGPELRVTEGDRVRANVTNQLPQSTAVHFHGQAVPNKMDGVPFITQPPINPGTTFTYEFIAKPFGSHMYHSHHNAAEQVALGLLGAFVVEPKDKSREPASDKEYTIILNDGPHGFTLNGKSFPATEPLTAKLGQKVRIRFMHEGQMIHPMHLHGMPMQVFARDGYPLPQPYFCDTLNLAPGERTDVLVDCDNPGTWAFHCHVLPHAESPMGMIGMVTALIVEA